MAETSSAIDIGKALTVPFAAGFVVQRILEILDPLFPNAAQKPALKKILMGLISLGIGLWLSASGIHVFQNLGASLSGWQEVVCSGTFISAGTEGFNTLLKFANYKKEASKADAADKNAAAGDKKLNLVNRQA